MVKSGKLHIFASLAPNFIELSKRVWNAILSGGLKLSYLSWTFGGNAQYPKMQWYHLKLHERGKMSKNESEKLKVSWVKNGRQLYDERHIEIRLGLANTMRAL